MTNGSAALGAARNWLARLRVTLADRRGAVLVDWVVLTAAALSLTFAATAAMNGEVEQVIGQTLDHARDRIPALD